MQIVNDQDMRELGKQIGAHLKGGEVIELVGDIGAGKTTLVKGIAIGLGIDDDVQSPSFTINRKYSARDGLTLDHYDFYRLTNAGIMSMEIAESLNDPTNIVVVEWGESVRSVLPTDRLQLTIAYLPQEGREITFRVPKRYSYLGDII